MRTLFLHLVLSLSCAAIAFAYLFWSIATAIRHDDKIASARSWARLTGTFDMEQSIEATKAGLPDLVLSMKYGK